jgi:hypothetical protein
MPKRGPASPGVKEAAKKRHTAGRNLLLRGCLYRRDGLTHISVSIIGEKEPGKKGPVW